MFSHFGYAWLMRQFPISDLQYVGFSLDSLTLLLVWIDICIQGIAMLGWVVWRISRWLRCLVYFLDNLMTMQRKFLGCLGS